MKRRYNVMFRLDAVLVEVKDMKAETLAEAIEEGKRLCLMNLTASYKGMTLNHLNGDPRVVGVATADAWDAAS